MWQLTLGMIHKLDPHFPIFPQEPQLGHQNVSTKLEQHASPFPTSSHCDLVGLSERNPLQPVVLKLSTTL